MIAEKPNTTISPMPAAEYFADHGSISQSMLKTFAERRRLYDAYYVSRSEPLPPPSDPMRKGTATHTALLEPDRFRELVVPWPDGMLSSDGGIRTNEAKRFRDDMQAAGKIVLKADGYTAIREMVNSVRRVCGKWLDLPGRKEQAAYWTNELTSLPMKMRLDWLVIGSRPVIFDLKTTKDASPLAFRATIERQRYWLQHPQYVEGIEAVTGETPLFYFIAVESEFPFACAIHEIDPDSAHWANMRRNELLIQLAGCLASGEFSEPWERQINALPLRPYCFASTIQPEPL